jgi:hypothetical protein
LARFALRCGQIANGTRCRAEQRLERPMTRIAFAILAALALSLAPPALAPTKSKRAAAKQQPAPFSQIQISRAAQAHAVYAPNGEYSGADPDPFIRMMLLRDANISSHTGP